MRLRIVIGFLLFFYLISSSYGQVRDTVTILKLLKQADESESIQFAKEKFEVAYALSSEIGYDEGKMSALPKLAVIEIQEDNLANGLRYLLEEVELLRQYNRTKKVADTYIQIGDLYSEELLFNEAIIYYQNAEQVAITLEGTNLNELYDKLGFGYTQLLLPDSAALYYLKLLDLESNNESFQVQNLRKLVNSYQKADDYQTALNYNLQIRSIMENSPEWEQDLGYIYNNLGYTYNFLRKHKEAIQWFLKAESYFGNEREQLKVLYTNLGVSYFNDGETKLAIQYLLKALSLVNETDFSSQGNVNNLLSKIYLKSEDFYNAQNYSRIAIDNAEQSSNTTLKSEVYATAADIHTGLYEYEEAIEAFQKHLYFRDSLVLISQIEQQQLLQEKLNLEKAEKEIRLLLIRGQMQDLTIESLELEKASQELSIANLTLQTQQRAKDIEILKQSETIREAELKNQALETERTRQLLQIAKGALERQIQQQQLSDLEQAEALTQAELKAKETQLIQKEQQNSILEREKEIDQLKLESQQKTISGARRIGWLLLLISLMILAGLIYTRRTNRKLAQQKLAIEAEQEKSESLLLNILPVSVAQELKEKGRAIPRRYGSVSILFSDFVGFTRISARSTPEKIIQELNECFMGFDAIMEEEGIEKIQTIGDGYLAVGGLPDENPDHAVKCVWAAKKMIDFLKERNENHPIQWNVRIGIHSGPITAGVVGTKKFAYNIFGDTVNTASRIETAGEQGRINISDATFQMIKDDFECEYRGKISAKGKGELDMYFVK